MFELFIYEVNQKLVVRKICHMEVKYQLEIFLKSSVYCTHTCFKDLYWKPRNYEEGFYYDFPLYTKGWHEIFMSINSFMILTYCLSDLINLIRFQFYYWPHHLMMARVIVLLACIFILSKSKLLLVVGRNFIKIQFFLKLSGFFCEVL